MFSFSFCVCFFSLFYFHSASGVVYKLILVLRKPPYKNIFVCINGWKYILRKIQYKIKCERSHFLYGWIEFDIWLSLFVICAMPCHGMAWHAICGSLSWFVLIRSWNDNSTTPITVAAEAAMTQKFMHISKFKLNDSSQFVQWSSKKSFIFSWPTQTSHHFTLRHFNWIYYLFFLLMFYFLLLKCFFWLFSFCIYRQLLRSFFTDEPNKKNVCVHFMSSHIHFIICL